MFFPLLQFEFEQADWALLSSDSSQSSSGSWISLLFKVKNILFRRKSTHSTTIQAEVWTVKIGSTVLHTNTHEWRILPSNKNSIWKLIERQKFQLEW